jgi:hypothetical protein
MEGSLRRRRENNIKVYLEEIRCGDIDVNVLTHHRNKCRSCLNTGSLKDEEIFD